MNFTWDSHRVEPIGPKYNVLVTEMEGMRKKTRLKSTKPARSWKLYFRVQNNTERTALKGHYDGQFGELTPFYWTSIPEHISDESSIYVRYTSYEEDPIQFNTWEISMTFEEVL